MTVLVDARNLNNTGLGNMARRVDKSTYAPVDISWTHERIHSGVHWFINESLGPIDVGEEPSRNPLIFLTPAYPQLVHFSLEVSSTILCTVTFWENVNPLNPAADATPFFNNRRPTANTIQTTRWTSLMVNVAAATTLGTATIGGAATPGSLAWWQNDMRLLLIPSTYYMLTFSNFANGIYFNYEADFLETAEIA